MAVCADDRWVVSLCWASALELQAAEVCLDLPDDDHRGPLSERRHLTDISRPRLLRAPCSGATEGSHTLFICTHCPHKDDTELERNLQSIPLGYLKVLFLPWISLQYTQSGWSKQESMEPIFPWTWQCHWEHQQKVWKEMKRTSNGSMIMSRLTAYFQTSGLVTMHTSIFWTQSPVYSWNKDKIIKRNLHQWKSSTNKKYNWRASDHWI